MDHSNTPWPQPPFRANFPGSSVNYLTITDLDESGSYEQTLALASLLVAIELRIRDAHYPNPNFNVIGAIPDIQAIGLTSFSFEIEYTIPSEGEPAEQATIATLMVLTNSIVEHGVKDLRATIIIGGLEVGHIGIYLTDDPTPIDRNVKPIFLAIGEIEGPVIEIGNIEGTWIPSSSEAALVTLERAFNDLVERHQAERFTVINISADVEGRPNLEARFEMRAWGAGSDLFLNRAAAAVVPALQSLLIEVGNDAGNTMFEIFTTEGEYEVVAFGRVVIGPRRVPVETRPTEGQGAETM